MIWAKFESQKFRDEAIKKCAKPAFKFRNCKIWAEKDLAFGFRQLISLLLGIRKDFIDRGLDKAGIQVDREHYMLSYYNNWVCKVYLDNKNKLQYKLNEEWTEYLCAGAFEELKSTCDTRITKGSGKGKSKSKPEQGCPDGYIGSISPNILHEAPTISFNDDPTEASVSTPKFRINS